MKQLSIYVFLITCVLIFVPASLSAQDNIFPALEAYKWQNKNTVDFDSLKYTGTHVILVFWNIINLEADIEAEAGYVPVEPQDHIVTTDSGESGLTDYGAVNWMVKAAEKYQDANVVVIGVLGAGTYSYGRSLSKEIDNIPNLRDRDHTLRDKICKQSRTCSYVVVSPEGSILSGYSGVKFKTDRNYFSAASGTEALKSTVFKGMDSDRRLTAVRESLRMGHIGDAYKIVKGYIGKDGTAKTDGAAKAWDFIQKYMSGIKAEVESLKEGGNTGEAFRVAENGAVQLKYVRDEVTDFLKDVLKELKKEKAVKQLMYQKGLYRQALMMCEKGHADKAKPYLSKIVETDPESYYGKAAKTVLKSL